MGVSVKKGAWRVVVGSWLVAAVYITGAALAGPVLGGGLLLAQRANLITTTHHDATQVAASPSQAPSPTQTAQSQTKSVQGSSGVNNTSRARSNPFAGEKLFIDPDSEAAQTVAAWKASRPGDASLMQKIASQPVAIWLGDWYANVGQATRQWIGEMRAQGALPVFVLYNIPNRDCGSYSAGGAGSADAYRTWIQAIAHGTSGTKAVFILEPDALAGWDCLSAGQRAERASLLRYAVDILGSPANHFVYLDAGNARWQSADTIAARLQEIGTNRLQGVALNVSNFLTTAESKNYGQRISSLTGDLHVVIDTSRNGQGPMPDLSWCNPTGRGLGLPPTTRSDSSTDALLWVKYPGESDGACNGGPQSGEWWPDYALGLAQRAAF